MTPEEISTLQNGSYLIPNEGTTESAIKIIEVNDKGFKFRRCNLYYEGEEFFLSKDVLAKSNWIPIPIGTQLLLF